MLSICYGVCVQLMKQITKHIQALGKPSCCLLSILNAGKRAESYKAGSYHQEKNVNRSPDPIP